MRQPAITLAGSLAMFALATGHAQQPTPTFRAATTLVEFTLVAVDAHGNPVEDLKQDEIIVTERDTPRDLAFFRFEGGTVPPGAPLALPPNVFTNRLEYLPRPPRNIIAIVMDGLNSTLYDQAAMRDQVRQYLRNVSPDTRVAIYRLGERVQVLYDFTTDIRALQARLEREAVQGQLQQDQPALPPNTQGPSDLTADTALAGGSQGALSLAMAEMAKVDAWYGEQVENRTAAMTWAGLEAIGNHLAIVPGRKSLVWITAGIPIVSTRNDTFTSYESAIRKAAQHLSVLGVVLYPVDAVGLRAPQMGTAIFLGRGQRSGPIVTATSANDMRKWSTMGVVAEISGGRVLKNTNDLTSGVKAATADLKGTYSVGFYVPETVTRGWHEFAVKVRRAGVKITHRQGYSSEPKPARPQDWTTEVWQATVQNAIGSSGIRIDARPQITAGDLIVVLNVAADDLYYHPNGEEATAELDIALAERGAADFKKIRIDPAKVSYQISQLRDAQSSFIRLPRRWSIEPDTAAVRVIVRDRVTERYGIVDIPIGHLRGR